MNIFDTSGFPPRWLCGGRWAEDPWIGWLTIFADLGIAAAYFTIPVALVYALKTREQALQQQTPKAVHQVILLSAAFIFSCGIGHVLDAMMFYWPAYGLMAVWGGVTAIISLITAAKLPGVFAVLGAARSGSEYHERYQLFESAFEGSSVGLALVGLDGTCLRANPALEKILGYSSDELHRASLRELIHPEDREIGLKEQELLFSGGSKRYSVAKRYIRKNGAVIYARLTVTLLRSEAGEPLHYIEQIEDQTVEHLSREKELEQFGALKQAHEVLEARLISMESNIADAQDSELRSALTRLDGVLEQLKEDPDV